MARSSRRAAMIARTRSAAARLGRGAIAAQPPHRLIITRRDARCEPVRPGSARRARRRASPARNPRRRCSGTSVAAEQQVDEVDLAHLQDAVEQRLGQRVEAIGDRHRHPGQRQFERHGARGGQRRTARGEGVVFLRVPPRRTIGRSRPVRDRRERLFRPPSRRSEPRRGTARRCDPSRSSASPNIGISRRTSPPRLPGNTASTSSSSAMPCAARKRAASPRPAPLSSTGCPTWLAPSPTFSK